VFPARNKFVQIGEFRTIVRLSVLIS
jgi:hypothetical protein